VIVVHLEWNLIFFVGEDKTLLVYEMNHSKVHALLARALAILRST
jgi:hypothetical protein